MEKEANQKGGKLSILRQAQYDNYFDQIQHDNYFDRFNMTICC